MAANPPPGGGPGAPPAPAPVGPAQAAALAGKAQEALAAMGGGAFPQSGGLILGIIGGQIRSYPRIFNSFLSGLDYDDTMRFIDAFPAHLTSVYKFGLTADWLWAGQPQLTTHNAVIQWHVNQAPGAGLAPLPLLGLVELCVPPERRCDPVSLDPGAYLLNGKPRHGTLPPASPSPSQCPTNSAPKDTADPGTAALSTHTQTSLSSSTTKDQQTSTTDTDGRRPPFETASLHNRLYSFAALLKLGADPGTIPNTLITNWVDPRDRHLLAVLPRIINPNPRAADGSAQNGTLLHQIVHALRRQMHRVEMNANLTAREKSRARGRHLRRADQLLQRVKAGNARGKPDIHDDRSGEPAADGAGGRPGAWVSPALLLSVSGSIPEVTVVLGESA
ncbi:uncharacterized protein BJX67DRAFT_379132 [Aspergillus lucknowensis]|uniref:Uncharacterized protein n=1 Tax=Aspergillus lucknowensis TaxID=176173 RepID=A0ABR4LYI8_9EURO